MAEKIKVTIDVDDKGGAEKVEELNDALDDSRKKGKKAAKSVEETGEAANRAKELYNKLGSAIKTAFMISGVMKILDLLVDIIKENQVVVDLLNQAMIAFKVVINGLVDAIEPLYEGLMQTFSDPKKAWDDLVQAFKDGYDWVYENIVENLLNRMVMLANDAQIAFLKLKKAYKDFTNDAKAAAKIQKEINALEKENRELQAENVKKNAEIVRVVKSTADKVVTKFKEIKKATTDAFDLSKAVVAARKETDKLEILYTGIVEKYDLMAEKQRQIRDDETKTISERIKANQELRIALDDGEKAEKANLAERIKNKQLELAVNKNDLDIQNEILALKQELIGVDAKYAGLRSEQLTNINSLEKERIELQRSLAEGTIEANKIISESDAEALGESLDAFAARKQALMDEFMARREALNAQIADEKEGTQAYVDAINEKRILDAQYAADVRALTKETDDYKAEIAKQEKVRAKEVAQAQMDAVMQGLAGVQQLVGEDSKFGKALAVAQAIINTYQGASKALGQGGVFGPIAAAGVIASGLAQVRSIMQTDLPEAPMGGGGGGMSTPSMAGPSVGIIGGQLDAGAQLQADIAGQMRKPARAYVVGQNVTSQQSLDRHIRQNATLGTK